MHTAVYFLREPVLLSSQGTANYAGHHRNVVDGSDEAGCFLAAGNAMAGHDLLRYRRTL